VNAAQARFGVQYRTFAASADHSGWGITLPIGDRRAAEMYQALAVSGSTRIVERADTGAWEPVPGTTVIVQWPRVQRVEPAPGPPISGAVPLPYPVQGVAA